MKKVLWILFACFSMSSYAANQQDAATEEQSMTAEEFIHLLAPQTGHIQLPGGVAELNLSDKFQYLSPESAERLLVDAWGNPPGNETLGMIIPTATSPLSHEGWGVVITYQEDGHVKDTDADDIDYDDLLSDMQEANRESNEARIKAGYSSMELLGWAEPPRYDQVNHKFYWAKEFKTDDSDENALNYNIRVLGRKGVLVLNAIAGINQLPTIKQETPEMLAFTNFTQGNRYEDFDSATDNVAEYGLAALVAGGVAAKMGLFAKLLALLVAFKKLLIIGVVFIGGVAAKLFGRKAKAAN